MNQQKSCIRLTVAIIVLWSGMLTGFTASLAQSSDTFEVSLGGYFKELGQLSFDNALSDYRYDNILHNRLETEWRFGSSLEIRADMRTRLLSGYTIDHTPGIDSFYEFDPNYLDLSWVWFDTDRTLLHSNIDRLHASYYVGSFEAHLGRQRINWGRTYVWNPNDLFNAFAFLDFDYEERPGVDALSVQYNWSYASSAEAGFRIADRFDEMVIAGKIRVSQGTYDLQIIGGHYFDYATVGGGWSGYLGDAGFKGEISYFHPEDRFFNSTGHITASTGIDYMLPNALYLQGELLYNGGFQRSRAVLNELFRPPSADDLFIAKTGIYLNGSYAISPLLNGSLGVLSSFDRSLFILIPRVTYSLSDDWDLLVLSQLLKGSVFNPVLETPNLLYFRFKWSF